MRIEKRTLGWARTASAWEQHTAARAKRQEMMAQFRDERSAITTALHTVMTDHISGTVSLAVQVAATRIRKTV